MNDFWTSLTGWLRQEGLKKVLSVRDIDVSMFLYETWLPIFLKNFEEEGLFVLAYSVMNFRLRQVSSSFSISLMVKSEQSLFTIGLKDYMLAFRKSSTS